ncbi:MAG: hypothetical protein ACYS8I_01280 [Planctomycetota bacterium]|jgi:hypothetical protein
MDIVVGCNWSLGQIEQLAVFLPTAPQELRERSMQEFIRARLYCANMTED